jgi:hypothetical protein
VRRSRGSFGAILFVVFVVIVIAVILTRPGLLRVSPSTPASSSQESGIRPRIGPLDIYPDESITPGAANPEITPDTIQSTICNPNWSTRSVRPPASYTNRLKAEQIQQFGLADTNMRDYEEDHLVPLEIGGHPSDPRNLWPEPYNTSIPDGGARYKDKVENYLHDEICAGRIPLQEAQREIAHDWYAVYVNELH